VTFLFPVPMPAQQPGLLPPPPPGAPAIAGSQAPGATFSGPSEIYQAAQAARHELESQLDNLKSERFSIAQRLREGGPGAPTGADFNGLQTRLVQIDQRIAAMDKQIADQDAAVAKAAAVPGAVIEVPPPDRNGPPEEVYFLSAMFMVVLLLPISIAWARRIWRRGAAVVTALPPEIYDRFTRLEQSLDSIAVEVERVGEGQRFLTRMQAEQQGRALGAGPAERIEAEQREREGLRRK
jgi:hypothetical protein